MDKALDISTDVKADVFCQLLEMGPVSRTRNKRSKLESELKICYRYNPR